MSFSKIVLISESNLVDSSVLTYEQWMYLREYLPEDIRFVDYQFPNEDIYAQYIANIHKFSDDEIQRLLGDFLLSSTALKSDSDRYRHLDKHLSDGGDFEDFTSPQYYRRLFWWSQDEKSFPPPWEGVTWVLDLLPRDPRSAIEVLRSYLKAHLAVLPDGRITGLDDAISVIRARYIGIPANQSEKLTFLHELTSREFEHLIKHLYDRMGYQAEITPTSRDGGRDVVAITSNTGRKERVAVECKLYSGRVGVRYVDRLQGVLHRERFHKGVIFATGGFTKDAFKAAEQSGLIELVSGTQIIILLNEYLGYDWPLRINRLIRASQEKYEAKLGTSPL